MTFAYPHFLVLLLLLPALYPVFGSSNRIVLTGLRFAIAALIVLALSRPSLNLKSEGLDLYLLLDRSASVGQEGYSNQEEVLRLLSSSKNKSSADRLAVITYGEKAKIEIQPVSGKVSPLFRYDVGNHGSNFFEALDLAAKRFELSRHSKVLVLSDGLYTGKNPLDPGLMGQFSGVPIWHRQVGRLKTGDVAAHKIVLPEFVPKEAGFYLSFELKCETETTAKYKLYRVSPMGRNGSGDSHKGQILAKGEIALAKGTNRFWARDIAGDEGLQVYRLEVEAAGDTILENNHYETALRVVSGSGVLIVSDSKGTGFMDKVLRAAAIPVDSVSSEQMDWSAAKLAPYKVVILENLPLHKLGHAGAAALSEAVGSGLVSLLVTGGENSFGPGGYHASKLADLLPVTLEIREELRRGRIAIAAVLDRSGSMSMTASDGNTKMMMANIGVANMIKLMTPNDQVSVIAVDSKAHLIVPLSVAEQTAALQKSVLKIESQGGGIFVRTGLEAAAAEIRKSKLSTRHIVLFSDAADAEQQDGTLKLVKKLRNEKIGTSVIGLGNLRDKDAAYLKQLAKSGNGKFYITEQAVELPRIFSQEIIRVSDSGFRVKPISSRFMPDITRLQLLDYSITPQVGGYNPTLLRKNASAVVVANDKYHSPLIAFWRNKKASVGSILFEVDGRYTGGFSKWPSAQESIVNLVRLLASNIVHSPSKMYANISNGSANIRLEVSDETADQLRAQPLKVKLLGPEGTAPTEQLLTWASPGVATAQIPVGAVGYYQAMIDLGDEGIATGPPLSLPYSAEYVSQSMRHTSGEQLLKELSKKTGGQKMISTDEIFSIQDVKNTSEFKDVTLWIALLVLLFVLLEIAEKRLSLFSNMKK